jgi:hypothetical protein
MILGMEKKMLKKMMIKKWGFLEFEMMKIQEPFLILIKIKLNYKYINLLY